MTAFDPQNLIDQTNGNILVSAAWDRAQALGRRDWGGDEAPPSIVRGHYLNVMVLAGALRKGWRDARGLPDDTEYHLSQMPTWGASGDSFTGAA